MRYIFVIAMLLSAATLTFAAEVRLSDFATPDDGLDDSAGFQLAIDTLTSHGGGTLVVSDGVWNLNGPVSFINDDHVNNSFTVKGNIGTVIKPHLAKGGTVFTAGNQNQLIFEDLIFVGDKTDGDDFGEFLSAGFVAQLRLTRCQFYGLKSTMGFLHFQNVDAVVKDTLFYGLASGVAVIWGENFRGLSVIDTEFLDYGHLNGTYYSKSAAGNPAWIRLDAKPNPIDTDGQRAVFLQNVRFDESGYKDVIANNVPYIQARGILSNIAPVDEATGFFLNNVKYAEIGLSGFGYSSIAKPAVTAVNGSTVYMDGISLGNGVFYGSRDQSSQSFFNLRNCTSHCYFEVQYPPEKRKVQLPKKNAAGKR